MIELFTGKLFLTCFLAWIGSDILKLLIGLALHKTKNKPYKVLDTGGFPSSHTTIVSVLFFSLGIDQGWKAPNTTLAGILAIIVMYDAVNLRFQAGLHSQALNKLGAKNPITGKAFKENLGHNYVEVLGGLIFGAICAVISYYVV